MRALIKYLSNCRSVMQEKAMAIGRRNGLYDALGEMHKLFSNNNQKDRTKSQRTPNAKNNFYLFNIRVGECVMGNPMNSPHRERTPVGLSQCTL